jgi:hypothetical protein
MHSFSQIEVKESQNVSSFANKIGFDNSFAMVSGHVCADVTLAYRDRWEDGSDVELWERDGMPGLLQGEL